MHGHWQFSYLPVKSHEYFICHEESQRSPKSTSIAAIVPEQIKQGDLQLILTQNMKGMQDQYSKNVKKPQKRKSALPSPPPPLGQPEIHIHEHHDKSYDFLEDMHTRHGCKIVCSGKF
jgi:hypothetical protein